MAATQKDKSQLSLARQLSNIPWCEQYERMISGMLYDAFTPELEAARFRARKICHEYNTTFPSFPTGREGGEHETNPVPSEGSSLKVGSSAVKPEAQSQTMEQTPKTLTAEGNSSERQKENKSEGVSQGEESMSVLAANRFKILSSLLGFCGSGTFIEPPLQVDYGSNISLGLSFYSNFNLTILDCALVTIGDRVMFGPNVSIYAATHETDVTSRREGVEYAKSVSIGDDCWIGGSVTILGGVKVGRGSTVAAGSLVNKDVPEWSVVMGVPARVVRRVEPVPPVE
ncbi:trimeric LpxA-like protein [Piedraia hortae CBS 480.64]|uniref:Trimeric LpxA-like protein n=1 Tax=Piedraia hortae CBS 480.64 TaxID=1314780 RepID=A0A6A7BPS4_9PEZI|nr:trimeric LpxA-like protein [Piedraia hortae CBS 480.64]